MPLTAYVAAHAALFIAIIACLGIGLRHRAPAEVIASDILYIGTGFMLLLLALFAAGQHQLN